ncbi:TPA: restriction endonuclease subunit S, partial [Streptococcus suis]|nr:restriction endonuclease subunit S [Streptococcus suis]
MPNKDKNIPKRRFKAFENADAWELRKIFEIADRFDNLRVPIASSLRVSGSTPYYGANGIQDYVEGYTHEGEFILVAEDGANDLKNYPVNLVNGKIWVNNHAHVLQGKNSIADNKFLAFSINQTNIESLLVGGGRAKLNSDVLMNIELKLPSPAEQEAIGTFFSTLDRQITLHQRKLDKLKSVKQAYLSEMFPAEGECVPKRRFPGFTD